MKRLQNIPSVQLIAVLMLLTGRLWAQQTPSSIQLSGLQPRIALDVPPGISTVHLCDLTPGNTYTVTAVGAVYGQQSVFALAPAATNSGSPARPALRFTAREACMDLRVTASDPQPLTTIPMYLSLNCESCPAETLPPGKKQNLAESANLSVTAGVNPLSLVKNTLIGGGCYDISNVTYSGPANGRGTFMNGAASIGIDKGIVLSTGTVSALPGPNLVGNTYGNTAGFNTNSPNDPDLATLTAGDQYDVIKLEFDFTPTADTVRFDYVFGSEEYCEFVGSTYNDVFGFFISGPGITGKKNLALIPSTNTPVAINNVNYLTNSQQYVNNDIFFPLCLLQGAANLNDCALDGWTKSFTATAAVIPCETYHIKLAIADISDGLYLSSVFLRANSFEAGGTAKAEAVYPGGAATAYEDCGNAYIKFIRDNTNTADSLVIDFDLSASSTATPGVDFVPIAGPVIIPPGATEVLVPIQILPDTLTEGQESIVLLLDNPCSCVQTMVEFLIDDKPPLEMTLNGASICPGASAILAPVVTGGVPPYTYQWNNGSTTDSITVNTAGTVVLTVTDACGDERVDSAQVTILPAILLNEEISFCTGDSVTINGITYTAAATLTDTLPGTGDACDTIRTIVISVSEPTLLTDTITFCTGDSVVINGTAYFGSGIVTDTLPGLGGACDTILTYVLDALPLPTRNETLLLCPGRTVTIGGVSYSAPGTVVDTIPGSGGGCDTVATYVLEALPQPTRTETIQLCPRSMVNIGGTLYTAPGMVVDTLPGSGGACDTIVTYMLEVLPQPVRAETVAFCPGSSVTIGGMVYTGPGTVLDTLPGDAGACDTIVTYTLELLPQPARSETIGFCPGDSVVLGGHAYSAPGTVVDTLAASVGCDTIVTYTLKFRTPAPSTVKITCPGSIVVSDGKPTAVTYAQPTASSDCPCPGMALTLTGGLPSGATFPLGATSVCYTAKDSCGNTASCCFQVEINETEPCDIKEIGCMKYELLTITKDAADNKTYRIRVTNNCSNEMVYTIFQLPNGVTAVKPLNNTLYTSPGGRIYAVRNPNAAPFYSIRFSAKTNGLANGQSDIFEYTLPPLSSPNYIHVSTKLLTQTYFEAYLNTFFCPVVFAPSAMRDQSEPAQPAVSPTCTVFPNPTKDKIFVDLSGWKPGSVRLRVFDSRGQGIRQTTVADGDGVQELQLPPGLAEGLYFMEVLAPDGQKQTVRFVVQH